MESFFILASVLVVAIYTITKSTPEKTLHKFEKSYNDMDFDKVLYYRFYANG